MNFAEQLRVLEAAQGDPAKLALATVDLKYPELPDPDRAALKEGLEAAAIPHWCDEGILGALQGISAAEAAARLTRLRGLTVVEDFKARGLDAVNVHEAARLALRTRMARQEPDRFRRLSARAVTCFEHDNSPAMRIEWVYHLLCAEPERGAEKLEELDRGWASAARPEDRLALAAALRELEDGRLVDGAARVEVLLCVAETRSSRGEASQLEALAREALALARSVNRPSTEARANSLLGDVLEEQGKLVEAQAAFGEDLRIFRRLAAQDPSNAGWQRDLAVAHNRVGGVLEAQDKLVEAQAAFGEGLRISRQLTERDPSNAGWQRDLAVAHIRVGDVLEAQRRLVEAHAAFGEGLRIFRQLAAQDPSNAGWQRELAVAHSRVGGGLEAQGKLVEAQAAFGEALLISRRLAAQDPSNASWQRGLAVECVRVARMDANAGRHAAALSLYEEAAGIFGALAERAPGFAEWAKDKAGVEQGLALCRQRVRSAQDADPAGST